MLKIISLLVFSYLNYSQAFNCDFPCPENAKCTGADKCTCDYGYIEKISDSNGMPYCQWQGTTTTKKTTTLEYSPTSESSSTIKPKINETHEDNLVNSELLGNNSYLREQQDSELNENGTKNLIQKMPTLFMENENDFVSDTTAPEEPEKTTVNDSMTAQNSISTTEPATVGDSIMEISTQTEYSVHTFKKLKENLQAYENLLHHNKLNSNNEEENTKYFKMAAMETTTIVNPTSDTFTTTGYVKSSTTDESKINVTETVKITKHVEHIHKLSAAEIFYTSLGVLCTFLAFLFAVTVLFECIKL